MSNNNNERPASNRIEFRKDVPDLLYRQAGGRCSVPRCKNPTMGPYYEADGTVNLGVACHIYSAAEGGPRGWGDKDQSFISSADNGLWCCAYHASLIDKNKGRDYPATTLFAWKKLAEARTQKLMNDHPSPLGWVESIKFKKFSSNKGLPGIKLSRCTLLWGENSSGKSILLEAAACVSQSKYAFRFNGSDPISMGGNVSEFTAEVIYSTADTADKKIDLEISGGHVTRREGLVPYMLPPGDIEIIYCSDLEIQRKNSEDDADYLTRILSVDRSALFSLLKHGTNTILPGTLSLKIEQEENENGQLNDVLKKDGSPYWVLQVHLEKYNVSRIYRLLSSSEQTRIILDLLITKAREVAKQRLTLLLIDVLASPFDHHNFSKLMQAVAQEDFQSVLAMSPNAAEDLLDFDARNVSLKDLEEVKEWTLACLQGENSLLE